MAAPLTKPIAGFRRVQIAWGETLQQIAAHELGDATRWAEIAALNKLTPPWISDAPSGPSVAVYGDTIMVPAPQIDLAVGAVSAEKVFKTDLALINGELQVVDGDFALVSGRENLQQALARRISVRLGELLFHLNYGCAVGRLKGDRNAAIAALLGSRYVQSALLSDARIAQVSKAVVTVTGDQLRIEANAVTVTGHPVDISLIV